jgi:hypothetical protein
LTTADARRASIALDDLVWTLQKIDVNQIRTAAEAFRASLIAKDDTSAVAKTYRSKDPNKHFLIGVLPRLFQDKALFPQNEDIAEFAANALGLEMSRTEKRSRYEIIGKVVCETDALDERALTTLVRALESLVGDKDRIHQMVERKRAGSFSWNETIQELLRT